MHFMHKFWRMTIWAKNKLKKFRKSFRPMKSRETKYARLTSWIVTNGGKLDVSSRINLNFVNKYVLFVGQSISYWEAYFESGSFKPRKKWKVNLFNQIVIKAPGKNKMTNLVTWYKYFLKWKMHFKHKFWQWNRSKQNMLGWSPESSRVEKSWMCRRE
jgi:hypothetical protein